MRIYLDVCCLNRPFDDQTQVRIRLETEAILTILSRCKDKKWSLVGSTVVDYEIYKTPDDDRRQRLTNFAEIMEEKITMDPVLKERALELESFGFRAFDAYHISCAEMAKVDVFLTTDDRLLKKSLRENVNIEVANPLRWLIEIGEKGNGRADNDNE